MMLSGEILLNICNIRPGDSVIFEFNGNQLIPGLLQALQQAITPAGLLAIPTCTPDQTLPKPAFNPALSPSEMGEFSEAFRLAPGVLRSNNPSHSLAAWGHDAPALIDGHRYCNGRFSPWGESAFGLHSPWDRLLERDARWITVNPRWSSSPLTALACVLFYHQHQGIVRDMPFPQPTDAWIEARLAGCFSAAQQELAGHGVWNLPARAAVMELVKAMSDVHAPCDPSPEFRRWQARYDTVTQRGYLQAGFSRVDITPSAPFLRWDGKEMTGVFRPLYARCACFASDGLEFALVVCDLLGLTRDVVETARRRVQEQTGVHIAVMAACTHAHATPDTIAAGYSDPAYLERLAGQLAECVLQARAARQPARFGWARVPIRGIAQSRRWILKTGQAFTTRYSVPSSWKVAPEHIASHGVIDPDLTVIRVEDLAGAPLGVISNFGCHPSIALSSAQASGDFTGEAAAALETLLGPGVTALCSTGAAADVDPTLEIPYGGPRDQRNAQRIGRIFAAQVLEAAERIHTDEVHHLSVASAPVTCPVRPDWLRLFADGGRGLQSEYARAWRMHPYTQSQVDHGQLTSEVQVVNLCGLALAAMPGEVFVSTAQELKRGATAPLMVIETANDYIGYIAPQSVFDEGGYEVAPHFAARVPPQMERLVKETAARLISEVTGATPGVVAEPLPSQP